MEARRLMLLVNPAAFKLVPFSKISRYKILPSQELLAWISVEDRIPSEFSFTTFIITPKLSGPLYIIYIISLNVYRTQIGEY